MDFLAGFAKTFLQQAQVFPRLKSHQQGQPGHCNQFPCHCYVSSLVSFKSSNLPSEEAVKGLKIFLWRLPSGLQDPCSEVRLWHKWWRLQRRGWRWMNTHFIFCDSFGFATDEKEENEQQPCVPHHSSLQLDTSRSEIDAWEVRYGTHAPDMAILHILTFTHGILLSFDGTVDATLVQWFHPSFLTENAVIMAISHLSKFVKNSSKGGL